MEIASLCSLPVGVLAWRSPRRALSVIAKMTLRLGDNEPALLDPQDPLSLDRPSSIGARHELLYATDFVPKKARCDVLLVGHARASTPSSRIEARLSVGGLERRFFALAAEPSHQIPLSSTYLRAAESASSGDVSVGPADARSPARSQRLPRARVDLGGVPLAPLAADFDFGAFNAAPPEQQIDAFPPGPVIELDALVAGRPRLRVQLPSERPRLYAFVKDHGPRGRRLLEVPLRCDTLWIDTDRAVCSLLWRGVIELARDDDEPPELGLTLAPFGLPERSSDLERRLEGAPRARAAEPSDFHEPIADEETPSTLEKKIEPVAPRPQGRLGGVGGFQLGALRPSRSEDGEEKTAVHALSAQAEAPPGPPVVSTDDEGAEELAAEELLEFEEIEPEEDLVDEPTPAPSQSPRAAPAQPAPGVAPRIQLPELQSKLFVLDDSEPTHTGFQVPKQAALPFETERPTPVPPAPDSASGSRASYPDALPFKSPAPPDVLPFKSPSLPDALPFKSSSPPDALPFKSSSPPDALPFKSSSPPDALPFKSPSPPDALPFKSPSPPDALPFKSKSKRRATHVDAPSPLTDPSSALPFVRATDEPARDASPASEPLASPPVLPFIKVPTEAPRDVAPASDAPPAPPVLPFIKVAVEPPRATEQPIALPPVLPFIKSTLDVPSNPVVMPPDVPSALPFTKQTPDDLFAPPPAEVPAVPVWVPSALPFAKPAEPAEPKNSPIAPLPAPAFPFLRPLIPVRESAPSLAAAATPAPAQKNKTAPQAPVLLPLDTYADIQIDLWDEGAVLEDVLARHGIDEITWRDNEQRRAETLAVEAEQGRSELALALAEAIDAALLRRSPPEAHELTLDEYIAVRVAVEGTPEPEPVLASKNLSEAKWQKLDRTWRKRARSDKALAKEIRTKLAEARKAAAAPPPPETNATKSSPKRRKARSRASTT